MNLTVPGNITQIPEFHDCQRLLVGNGAQYGPEAAVYAHPLIVSLLDTLIALESANVALRAIAVAEIISADAYPLLHIELGVNCLYMYTQQGQPQAFMLSVTNEADCGKRLNPGPPLPGFKLDVTREPEGPEFTADDYPAAARWDWDDRPVHKKQVIGIPGGTAWCLIGHANAQSWRRYDRPGSSHVGRRPFRIRGWYDEQRLGLRTATGGPVALGQVFGTIFPDSLLGDFQDSTFEQPGETWIHVAAIKLHGSVPEYKTKFNLDRTPTDADFNQLYLCKGDSTRCIPVGTPAPTCPTANVGNEWYAKIISFQGDTKYNCVIRHLHPGFTIPGTARWWWLWIDEGIWTRCPQGCCQVT